MINPSAPNEWIQEKKVDTSNNSDNWLSEVLWIHYIKQQQNNVACFLEMFLCDSNF